MKFIYGLIISLAIIAVIVLGLGSLTQSRASLAYEQGRARAMIIEAQGQSRLDSAQAAAVTTTALLPWLIVLCVSGFVGVAMVIVLRRPAQTTPPQIIERHIILLPAGYNRREMWQAVSRLETKNIQQLIIGDKE